MQRKDSDVVKSVMISVERCKFSDGFLKNSNNFNKVIKK